MQRFRLQSGVVGKPRVDRRGNGKVRGVSVITEGPALGHGFEINDLFVDQVVEKGENLKARWTHGNLCSDGLGKGIGRWHNFRKEVVDGKARAIADLHLSKAAHSFHPEGHDMSAADLILHLADESPDELGVSIVFSGEQFEDEDTGLTLSTLEDLARGDIVADPAANPDGLFAGSGSELAELATDQIDTVIETFGEERVLAFLSRYLAPRGLQLSRSAMAQPAKPDADATELRAQNEALKETVKSLQDTVKSLQEAEKQRQLRAQEDYVQDLQRKAVALQSPIPEPQLQNVRSQFARGDEETARLLGEAYLSAAEAKAGLQSAETKSLGTAEDDEKAIEADLAKRAAAYGLKRGE